jgi:hypothetical protein
MTGSQTPGYWLKTAIELRSIAGRLDDPVAKEEFRNAADRCEVVALMLEALTEIEAD